MNTVPQTYRISPESILRLRLISAATKKSMSKLLNLMIDELWEQYKDEVTTVVSKQVVDKKARKILKKMVVK